MYTTKAARINTVRAEAELRAGFERDMMEEERRVLEEAFRVST